MDSSVEIQPFGLGTAKVQSHYAGSQKLLSAVFDIDCVLWLLLKSPWQLVVVVDKLLFTWRNFLLQQGELLYSHKATCTCFVIGFKFNCIFSTGHFTGFVVVRALSLYLVLSTYFIPQRTDHCIAAGTLKRPSLSSGWGAVMTLDT